MTKATMVLAAAGACLLVVTGFQMSAQRAQATRLVQLEAEVARLQSAHRELLHAWLSGDRASRRELAMHAGYGPANAARPAVRQGAGAAGVGTATPADARRQIATELAQQQRTFAAEPVNPAWAGTTQHNLEDVLDGLAQQGIVHPRSAAVDCRSNTCRISLGLSGSEELDALMSPLLTEISDDLPEATILPVPSADGLGMDVQIFATTGRGKPPRDTEAR
jgi:hypothetical protein